MSLEEYLSEFTLFSRYDPFLVSNPRDEMSRFVTCVFDLVKEECRKSMLHGYMNNSILRVYPKSIEESKHSKISSNFKRSRSDEQNKPKLKKRPPKQDGSSASKVKIEVGSSCEGVKPTYARCKKKHFGKCLVGTAGCFGSGKDVHKVRIVLLLWLEKEKPIRFLLMLRMFMHQRGIVSMFSKLKEQSLMRMPVIYNFLCCVVMGS